MSQTRALLATFAGGSRGSRTEFIRKLEDGKTTTLRLYRFTTRNEVGVPTKSFCGQKRIHFNGAGKAPSECPGSDTCDRCKFVAQMEARGSKDDEQKIKDMSVVEQAAWPVINLADPTKIVILESGWGLTQQILLQIARRGGWTSTYPKRKEMSENPSLAERLVECIDRGVEKIAGPTGQNICITYNKGQGSKTYDVFISMDDNQVLPFLEDDTVPNPDEVYARMRAKTGGDE